MEIEIEIVSNDSGLFSKFLIVINHLTDALCNFQIANRNQWYLLFDDRFREIPWLSLSASSLFSLVLALLGQYLLRKDECQMSDFFSSAFKIALRQIRQDNSTSSTPKPRNDSLLQQVNSLRPELQLLASNRSVTIVTSTGSGSSRYTIVIVVVVMGYGYSWWKGWKLPELMFATRRSLSDVCGSVSKQLESVYTSISATKHHLISRIDRVDSKIDNCMDNNAATRDEVSEIRGKVRTFGEDVQLVHLVVQSLNETNYGVGKLVAFVRSIETSETKEQIEAPPSSSSRPALAVPSEASSAQAGSLPPNLSGEPSSPSASSVSPKELGGISDVVKVSSESSPQVSNDFFTSEQRSNENSGFSSVFGRKFPGIGVSFLTRSHSALQSFK